MNDLPGDFDPNVYLELNPDVARAGVDPATHYLQYGAKEGRLYRSKAGELALSYSEYISRYSDERPVDQNAFDLFQGVWSSAVPGITGTGNFQGFADPRITWVIEQLGGVTGLSVLELGPLEAGHSYMLEAAGANVEAIEANYGAFMRCLLVKNFFNLNAKFVLGDFQKLKLAPASYDLVLASGVLYHMTDPIKLIENLSAATSRLFLWTHYFDEDKSLWSAEALQGLNAGKWDTEHVEVRELAGTKVRMVRQAYGEALDWDGFCGGPEEFSYWIYKEDLLSLLTALGFTDIRISFDAPDHIHGPSFAVLAQKEEG